MALSTLDASDLKRSQEERALKSFQYRQKNKPRRLGPDVLVKTSRSGKPFKDHDKFGLDFNVEYSLNKNNRWELPEVIAGELPRHQRATLSTVNVNLAFSKKELQKIEETKSYDQRFHLKGASAIDFLESKDGEMTKKMARTGRAQLRTWNNPKKHSRNSNDCPDEEIRVICICGKCRPEKENILDYTVLTYTTTCKDGDRRFWRMRQQQCDGDEGKDQGKELTSPTDDPHQQFVAYLPKKKKNEVRRQKHTKHMYAD
ncbi:unnamed protein product, partial [Mesorhabditis belari]|uniref:Uncharacterized protein n=1 Tax=Mesorhabditis belari TaxID=2138241 RepID=A0AAF3J2W0_9BILA